MDNTIKEKKFDLIQEKFGEFEGRKYHSFTIVGEIESLKINEKAMAELAEKVTSNESFGYIFQKESLPYGSDSGRGAIGANITFADNSVEFEIFVSGAGKPLNVKENIIQRYELRVEKEVFRAYVMVSRNNLAVKVELEKRAAANRFTLDLK